MSSVKFIKMWTCSACGDPLGKTCVSCKKHPDRVPRIVEWFMLPPTVKTCECQESVMIRCQREGCTGTRWLNKMNTKHGMSRSASLFCSRRCNCLHQNVGKERRQIIPCGWCKIPVKRKQSEIRNFKNVFCRPDHFQMFMKKKRYEEKLEEKKKIQADDVGLLHCSKCNDVVEHDMPRYSDATCLTCGQKKKMQNTAMSSRETQAILKREKELSTREQ